MASTTPQPAYSIQDLTLLLPSHPSLFPIISNLRPLTHPASSNSTDTHRFFSRLNTFIVSKESVPQALEDRINAWRIAKLAVEMDEEGYVIGAWGKIWVGALMPLVSMPSLPPTHVQPLLELLTTLFSVAPGFPTFSRETAMPAIPKLSQAVTGLFVRAVSASNFSVIETVLPLLPNLLRLSPTPSRPLVPLLTPPLQSLLLSPPSLLSRSLSADLLATMHILSGKLSAGLAFKTDINLALSEMKGCLAMICVEGWEEVPGGKGKVEGAKKGVTEAVLGELKGLGEVERLERLMAAVEGWLCLVKSLLQYPTARPVSLPLGTMVSTALRFLRISYDTPFTAHIDPETKAKLLSLIPRLTSVGMKMVVMGSLSVGDHMLPYVPSILEHTVYLLESCPPYASQTRLALLRFHSHLLSTCAVDPASPSFHIRLLKLNLPALSKLFDTTPAPASGVEVANGGGGTKKGKKRAREAEEDSLVGGLEGKTGRGLGRSEGEAALEMLKLNRVLQSLPSLPQSLLSVSVRVHLSLSLALNARSSASVSAVDLGLRSRLNKAVEDVLVRAAMMGGGSGVGRPWVSLVVGSDISFPKDTLPHLLHPMIPPMNRSTPISNHIVFHNPPSEEEVELMEEMELARQGEADSLVAGAAKRLATSASSVFVPLTAPSPMGQSNDVRSSEPTNKVPAAGHAPHPIPGFSQSQAASNTLPPAPSPPVAESGTPETSVLKGDKDTSIPAASLASLQDANPHTAIQNNQITPSFMSASTTLAPKPSVALEGSNLVKASTSGGGGDVRYDSEGEEIPTINVDSDTDEGSDDEDMQ